MNMDEGFDKFKSLNGGILINHDRNKTINQIAATLLKKENITIKNDLLFIGRGIKKIEAASLDGKIESSAKHYRTWATKAGHFRKNKAGLQEMGNQS